MQPVTFVEGLGPQPATPTGRAAPLSMALYRFKVQVDIYMEPLGRIEEALTNWMVKIRTATKLTRDLPRRNCRRKGTENGKKKQAAVLSDGQ